MIPKSVKENRIQENFALDFSLSEEDMAALVRARLCLMLVVNFRQKQIADR